MSMYNFEKDINSAIRMDVPFTQGPVPRWQRKALESSINGINTSLNVSALANTSCSQATCTVKSPARTPKSPGKVKSGSQTTPGRNKTPKTPSGSSGDRFIPNRSGMQLEVGQFMLSQECARDSENVSPNTKEYKTAMNENLNGDLSNFRILAYQNKAPQAPEGHSANLKMIYCTSKTPGSTRKGLRYIPQAPDRILDAPDILDDYYLNLIDWSCLNHLAVALGKHVFIWNAGSGETEQLMELEEPGEYISSVSWVNEGNILAVGTSTSEVQLWDVSQMKRMRVMRGHTSRVASLSWNTYILSSGSRSGIVHHHDVRVADHHVGTLHSHTQEVCGLKWSPDGRYLATGGNDNILNIWPFNLSHDVLHNLPLYSFSDHLSAVKAIAWCPWQPHILASGGGTADRSIRFWNCNLGTQLNHIDTKSQVCSLLWSKEYKEIISGHGFANNQLIIWKYPSMSKVAELTGHTARVLHLALSPDGTTVVSAGADETLRLWRCFASDQTKKKKVETGITTRNESVFKFNRIR